MRARLLILLPTIATLTLMGCERMGNKPPWWPSEQQSSQPPPTPSAVNPALLCPAVKPRASLEPKAEPKAVGPDASTIQSRVREHYTQFRTCYDSALSRNRAATGRVEIRFTILPSGRVEGACVGTTTTLQDGDAVECIVDVFQRVTFGPGNGPTQVMYPVFLVPRP